MDHLRNQLKQAAIEVTNDFRQRGLDLKKDLQKAEFRVLQIKTALESSNLAIDRLKGFQADIGGDLQCPRCWISRGLHVAMTPQSSDSPDLDVFRCRECQFEFEV